MMAPVTRYVEDSVNPAGLQPGYFAYAGYWNGPFANLTDMRRTVAPGARVIGVATRLAGSKGADVIDLEPGTCGATQAQNFTACLEWLRQGYSGQFRLPLIYTMASWLAPLEDFLTAHAVPRSRYHAWSAHAGDGQHYCGPGTCGYGRTAADATQYLFAADWDRSCFQDYLFDSKPAPAPVPATPPPVQLGDTGQHVRQAQGRLVAWGYLPEVAVDGTFGAWTELATVAFQKARSLSADGIIGPRTWAALDGEVTGKASEPVPEPPYQYAAPYGLRVTAGHRSFRATWMPPAHPGQPGPEFQVQVFRALAKNGNQLAPSYPRVTSGTSYQGGSLERGVPYLLHVVAGTGDHARPLAYAQAAFRTG